MMLSLLITLFVTLIACRGDTSITNPTQREFRKLESSLCGNIVLPTDGSWYNEANKNGWFHYNSIKSSAIIYSQCEEDVVKIVNFIQKYNMNHPDLANLKFRIRSGGHSYGGFNKCDGCITIDLSKLKNIQYYNKDDDIMEIGPGVLSYEFLDWMEFVFSDEYDDNITMPLLPHALCPNIAFGGYGQGGGYSLLMRKYGLNCDYIKGINVVLSNGQLINTMNDNNNQYKDLLWAIAGAGGGNFGIITKYYYKMIKHPKYIIGIDVKYAINENKYSVKYPMMLFKNYYNPQNKPSTNLTTYLFLMPETNLTLFPYGYSWIFTSLYIVDNNDNFDQKINIVKNKLFHLENENNLQHVEQVSTIKKMSYYDLLKHRVYPLFGYDQWTAHANSRFIKNYNDFNDKIVEKVTNILYDEIVVNNVYNNNIRPMVVFESLLGAINDENKKNINSFPNRDAWCKVIVAAEYIDANYIDDANEKIKMYDESILSLLGNYKYINYQDQRSKDLNVYYDDKNTFQNLQIIKTKYDKHNFFQYPMSIQPNNTSKCNDEICKT